MRIAMFGGSFNPIHNGHLDIARAVRSEFAPDRLIFVVAGDPPHKTLADNVPAAVRFEMTRRALENEPGMEASDIEMRRGGKSYTADTVDELMLMYPGAEICVIVGKDMLDTIESWHEPERMIKNAVLIGADRPNVAADLEDSAQRLRRELGAKVLLTTVGGPDISSTMIRDAVRDAKPVYHLTPQSVWSYVYENGLYQPDEIDVLLPRLKKSLSPKRYLHTMGAMAEAIELAGRYGYDGAKARLAALLHDCGKVDHEAQLTLAGKYGLDADCIIPALLHEKLSAIMAKAEYGVTDRDIINAIDCHTTGRVGMTLLDKLLFVADKTERLTRSDGLMGEARALAYEDIDRAVLKLMDMSIEYVLQTGGELDGCTLSARDDIINKISE